MIEIVAGDGTENIIGGAHQLTGSLNLIIYNVYRLVFAFFQAVIVKSIVVPPHLGVAPVLTGKSLLLEAYHQQKEVL